MFWHVSPDNAVCFALAFAGIAAVFIIDERDRRRRVQATQQRRTPMAEVTHRARFQTKPEAEAAAARYKENYPYGGYGTTTSVYPVSSETGQEWEMLARRDSSSD